jgi:DNA topoisomerase-3
MRVLCVAEKPSIARSITEILSGGQFTNVSCNVSLYRADRHVRMHVLQRPSDHKFIKNYDFDYPQTNAHFTVTSVLGHLTTHAFGEAYRIWHSCDPFALFDAPVYSQIPADNKSIERNLINEAKRSNMLMIWTDCDREGEHIGSEVARVCRGAKRDIVVKRARFSAIIAQCVSYQHPIYNRRDVFLGKYIMLLNTL